MASSKEFIKNYFQKRATAFPDFYTKRPLLPIESHIVKQIPSNAFVLDLCCGGGEIAIAVAKKGAAVLGVDNVPKMIELCKAVFAEAGSTGLFRVADATELPFDDASFTHVVCAGNSLNSMSNQDARLTILEAARVVKPDGALYLTILSPLALRNLAAAAKGAAQRAPSWGFYYRSSYGLSGTGEVPTGMSFLLTWGKVKRYLSEAGLEWTSSNWSIGLQASHTLLTCHKRGR